MIEAENLLVRHGDNTVLQVDRIAVDGTGLTAILGHNGSGKSTLMKVLAKQLRPNTGSVSLDGQSLESFAQRELARRIAYLPQQLPEAAGMTVSELVGLGRFAWRGTVRRFTDEDRDIAQNAMRMTGVDHFADRQADSLSGGERQRAWVAMLLAQAAPTLLLDEPTSALDLAHQYELVALLRRLNREASRSVVVVLHDINLAARFADRLVVLKSGCIAFDGPPDALLRPHLLSELFGVQIDLVDHAPSGRPIAVVNG